MRSGVRGGLGDLRRGAWPFLVFLSSCQERPECLCQCVTLRGIHAPQNPAEYLSSVISERCQQALAVGGKGQLDMPPVPRQIASVKQSRLDQPIADPASGGEMYIKSLGNAGRVEMTWLRGEYEHP